MPSTTERDAGAANFTPPERIEVYLTAKSERRLLNRLCAALPPWMTSDHLSAIGLFGAVLSGLSYVAANWSPIFFWLSSVGLLINWFGDSLDGSLARYRKTERPRYGYFVDHSLDVINYCWLFVGLGFSPYIPMNVALFALIGILLMHVYTLMSNHLSENYNATVFNLGPTELRLVFVYLNAVMYIRGPLKWGFLGFPFSPYVVGVAVMGVIFTGIFVVDVVVLASKLKRENERPS
jgi:phosphatidylglycerophosphate synthase